MSKGKDHSILLNPGSDGRSSSLDKFYLSPAPYYVIYLLVAVFLVLAFKYDIYWFAPWLVFCALPVLDTILPWDLSHPDSEDPNMYSPAFKLCLHLWIPTSVAMLLLCSYRVVSSELSIANYVLLAMTCGLCSGAIGAGVSHELFHKPNSIDRSLGYFQLFLFCYPHFFQEHLLGHHVHVATPVDPATSKKGQSFYDFFVQSLVYTWKNSWKMEQTRLQSQGIPLYHPWLNYMIRDIIVLACIGPALGIAFGSFKVCLFFYLQALCGIVLVEGTNYIEHYGLQRKMNADGTYETVKVWHSWNAPHTITNFLLFKLQRHSDHHAYALRPYQVLRNFSESPMLPTSYSGMIMLAFFPPLFRHVMDGRLAELNQGKMTNNNKLNEDLSTKVLLVGLGLLTNLLFLL